MVGAIVTFEYGEDFDRARLAAVAAQARDTFDGMPGLRSKAFTVDEQARRAVNVYVWESRDAATAFFTPELTEMVTGLYGVRPTIDIVDVLELVENAAALASTG